LGLVIALAACSDEEDSSQPILKSFSFNGESDQPAVLGAETFTFEAQAEDNENLKRLYLRIESELDDWYYFESFALSGSNSNVSESIELPNDATPGPCSFIITVEDQSGNESQRIIPGEILDNRPQINLTSPTKNSDGKYVFIAGAPVIFDGLITDNEDLSRIVIRIQVSSPYIGGPQEVADEEVVLEGTNDTSYDFGSGGYSVNIPQNAINVNYRMTFSAFDNKGNFQTIISQVEIRP